MNPQRFHTVLFPLYNIIEMTNYIDGESISCQELGTAWRGWVGGMWV